MAPKPSTASKPVDKVTATSAQPKKRAAASEIDDIFAKKPKPSSTAASTAPDAAPAVQGASKKKQKVKTAKSDEPKPVKEVEAIVQPKKAPETVVDTSSVIESYKPAIAQATKKAKHMTDEEKKAAEEEQRFRDSRGTSESSLPLYP